MFLLYIDKADKAKEYVDRMLKIKPQSPEGLALKGWVEVKNQTYKDNRED